MYHILGLRADISVVRRARMEAEDRKAGCVVGSTPEVTKVLIYHELNNSFLRARQRGVGSWESTMLAMWIVRELFHQLLIRQCSEASHTTSKTTHFTSPRTKRMKKPEGKETSSSVYFLIHQEFIEAASLPLLCLPAKQAHTI